MAQFPVINVIHQFVLAEYIRHSQADSYLPAPETGKQYLLVPCASSTPEGECTFLSSLVADGSLQKPVKGQVTKPTSQCASKPDILPSHTRLPRSSIFTWKVSRWDKITSTAQQGPLVINLQIQDPPCATFARNTAKLIKKWMSIAFTLSA